MRSLLKRATLKTPAESATFEPLWRPQSMVAFGDSITAIGYGVSGTTAYYGQRGWWAWANAMLGWRFKVLGTAGVAGNTIADMVARVQTDVVALAPGWVFLNGGINDVIGGASYATITGRFQSLFDTFKTAHIRVVCCTVNPSSGLSAGQNAIRDQVNAWLRAYAATNQNVVLVDTAIAIQDPADVTAMTGYTQDGLHPSAKGAMAMGYVAAETLRPLTVPRNLLASGADSTNLYGAVGMLNGDTGAGIATGWNKFEGGTASTWTKVARTDGVLGEWQQVVTPAGANTGALYPATDITTGWAIGDTVIAQVEIVVSGADTTATGAQLQTRLELSAKNGGTAVASGFCGYDDVGSVSQTSPLAYSGVMQTPPFVIPATTTNLRVILWGQGGATRKWGRLTVRKV